MQAYLIDPESRTIEPVEYSGDSTIHSLIGADTITAITIPDPDMQNMTDADTIYIDDEGLMKAQGFFFRLDGQPLAGKGLVLGTDAEGDSTEPMWSIERYRGMITFHTADELGFDPAIAPMDQTDEFDPVFVPFEPSDGDFSEAADFIANMIRDEQIDKLVKIMLADNDAAFATRNMIEHIDLYREALARYDAAKAATWNEAADAVINIDGDKAIDLTISSEQT